MLLIAKSSDFQNTDIVVPGLAPGLQTSQFVCALFLFFSLNRIIISIKNWNFTTVGQTGLNNRSIRYPRGFVLGGSTSISNRLKNTSGIPDLLSFFQISWRIVGAQFTTMIAGPRLLEMRDGPGDLCNVIYEK